ncbi:hypothetical protein PR048_012221 [Dryococelus australis]|uniref:Uncharacterized protein n=1 Tax=Dryococelus australis TaxID=614101 RepID=A0ABQ9HPB1_9NEOP|nr:hypothetical protein PR048_012221 [Dryococelus australis]
MRETIRRKWPPLWRSGDLLLHHDKTSPHTDFWKKTTRKRLLVPSIHQICHPLPRLLFVPNNEKKLEMDAFLGHRRDETKIAGGTDQNYIGRVLKQFPTMTKMLGQVYYV